MFSTFSMIFLKVVLKRWIDRWAISTAPGTLKSHHQSYSKIKVDAPTSSSFFLSGPSWGRNTEQITPWSLINSVINCKRLLSAPASHEEWEKKHIFKDVFLFSSLCWEFPEPMPVLIIAPHTSGNKITVILSYDPLDKSRRRGKRKRAEGGSSQSGRKLYPA